MRGIVIVTMAIIKNQRILAEHTANCKMPITHPRNQCHFAVNACNGITFHTGITTKCARVKTDAKQ